MSLVFKVNRAKIRKNEIKKNKSGFLVVPVYFMRTGILLYRDWDSWDIVREYVSPDELFKKSAMDSASGMIFTEEHPLNMVFPDNFRELINGVIHQPHQVDIYAAGTLTVYDGETARDIENSDKDEVSAGYWCNTTGKPGISPDKEAYDSEQIDLEFNHTARVWFGRAGEEVRIRKNARLNGVDYPIYFEEIDTKHEKRFYFNSNNIILPDNGGFKTMIFKRNNGVTRDVKLADADELFVTEVMNESETAVKNAQDEAATAKSQVSSLQAELDMTQKKLNEFEKKDFRAELKERLNLEDYVKPVLGNNYSYDKATDIQLKKDYLDKTYPDMKMNEKEDPYILSSFDFHQKTNPAKKENEQDRYNDVDNRFRESRQKASELQEQGAGGEVGKKLNSLWENMEKKRKGK